MKKLPLTSSAFIYLEQAFKEWLDILGYAPSTVYYLPLHVREFFYWLEQKGHSQVNHIDIKQIRAYYTHLSTRGNQRKIGGLSSAHLNKHLQALDRFCDYLRQAGKINLPKLSIHREDIEQSIIHILTPEQIKLLYQATFDYQHKDGALAIRDRAMLAVFYGCGLRRNEGYHLDLEDVDLERRVIHVRKGKNYQQRFVPFNHTIARYLSDYRFEARPKLLYRTQQATPAYFVTERGSRMHSASMANRLNTLQQRTDDPDLKAIPIHLHLLRHSIATHLLQQGMKLEQIAKFLGHQTLEATQIYTHLADENLP